MTRRILITGASSGIGLATARLFLAEGWQVGLMARRRDRLEAAADGHPRAIVLPGDVSDPASVRSVFDAFLRAAGGIDVLFNNAGVFAAPAPIDAMDLAEWDRAVSINLTGMMLCARAAFAAMRAQGGGRIINNGSISAHVPRPHALSYTVTKHAITGLTRQLALDGRDLNIACGQIDIGNAESEIIAAIKARAPETPTMSVEDAARSVLHMASLPLSANVLTMTVMATGMPYVGRG